MTKLEEISVMVAFGYTDKQIGKAVGLTHNMVKKYNCMLYESIGASDRLEYATMIWKTFDPAKGRV